MISELDGLFHPKTVILYKASQRNQFFIEGFIRQGFDLKNLYIVSSKDSEILGIKCYDNFDDIPIDTVDLLILSVRRDLLISSLTNILTKKSIKFIHIFTAGTGEFDDKGIEIENEIKGLLDKYSNTRAIGPNCMGIYSPLGKIAYYSSFPIELGNIALVFQSGDLHSKMVKFGSRRFGMRFSYGLSIGNCIDIQISEIIEFFDEDRNTDVICVYFEGFPRLHDKEGIRLLKTLKTITKPILFMRGGRTRRGQAAVITHTGSLATDKKIWNAIFQQTNVIEVPSSLEELLNYAYIFSNFIKRNKALDKKVIYPKSKRTLVILWSGGFGILATDSLVEMGLELPIFQGSELEKLKEIYPIKIGSLTNPFDLPWVVSEKVFLEVSKAAIDDNIDFVIVETDAWKDLEGTRFQNYLNNLLGIKEHVESLNKVFVIVLHEYPSKSRAKFNEILINNDFLVYPDIISAGRAFLKLYDYGKKLQRKRI